MVYLDYSATTPVNKDVLETFNKVCLNYPGNPNSIHKLGFESNKLMEAATEKFANLIKVNSDEVIFTSGASESNNLAIFGVLNKYKNRGKRIITTKLEHSSILSTVNSLRENYDIQYVKILDNGLIDMDDFKNKLNEDTILVSICEVNSEIGLIQPVNEIGKIVKEYPQCIFHVDGTQALGKKHIDLTNIDLYSCSSHKIYGLKGIGALIKKRNIEIEPIIYGGKSQTIYRAGTPALPLIVSFTKALSLTYENLDNNLKYVKELNTYLKDKLKLNDKIIINSNDNCVPHIVNISILGIKPETMLHALEAKEIYISTKTACSSNEAVSLAVYSLTKDEERSKHSIRISLSHLTTKEDIDYFVENLNESIKKLGELNG